MGSTADAATSAGSSSETARRAGRAIPSSYGPALTACARRAARAAVAGPGRTRSGNRQTIPNIPKKGRVREPPLPDSAGMTAHRAGRSRHNRPPCRLEIPAGSRYLEFVCVQVRVRHREPRSPARAAPDRGQDHADDDGGAAARPAGRPEPSSRDLHDRCHHEVLRVGAGCGVGASSSRSQIVQPCADSADHSR